MHIEPLWNFTGMQPVLRRTGSQKQSQLNIFHNTILLNTEYHYLLEVLIPQITIMPFASFVNILCTISLQVLSRYTELPANYSSLKCNVDSTSYSSYHFQNKSASLSMGDKCKKWTTLNSVFQLQCIALINWFFNVHTYTWYSWQCRKITQLHTHSAVAYVVKTTLLGL